MRRSKTVVNHIVDVLWCFYGTYLIAVAASLILNLTTKAETDNVHLNTYQLKAG